MTVDDPLAGLARRMGALRRSLARVEDRVPAQTLALSVALIATWTLRGELRSATVDGVPRWFTAFFLPRVSFVDVDVNAYGAATDAGSVRVAPIGAMYADSEDVPTGTISSADLYAAARLAREAQLPIATLLAADAQKHEESEKARARETLSTTGQTR